MSDVFMIDFSANAPLPFAELLGRFVNPAAVINRCLFHPNPQGARLVSPQVTLIMHEDEPFEIDWRGPYELQPARHRVEAGQFHLVPAHTPMEWHGRENSGRRLLLSDQTLWIASCASSSKAMRHACAPRPRSVIRSCKVSVRRFAAKSAQKGVTSGPVPRPLPLCLSFTCWRVLALAERCSLRFPAD